MRVIGILMMLAVLSACGTGYQVSEKQEEHIVQADSDLQAENAERAENADRVENAEKTEEAGRVEKAEKAEESVQRQSVPSHLIAPQDFLYAGAFRLPDGADRPLTFAYGGEAMTYNPNGDPASADSGKGYPGSLFVVGHNRMPYGELPDGNQIAEISIPEPVKSSSLGDLNQASFIQYFHNAAEGWFESFEEIPRVGLEYLETPVTGPLLHLSWGQHFHDEPGTQGPTHAWFSPNLAESEMEGSWYIGSQSHYSVNNYIFQIPQEWADTYAGGRLLAAGRFRDGGWSGMGPSLFAYLPWTDDAGTPAEPGTRLQEMVLLKYAKSTETEDIERCLEGYQHGDEWEGGAWIETASGRSAVLFAGTKSAGTRYWYGFMNAEGSEYPCLQEEFIGEFTLCRSADGTPCPDETDWVCDERASERGWWSTRFTAQFLLYDPDDLARVVRGSLEPWEPQPYAVLDIDKHLFLTPSESDARYIGTGEQRRYRIGDVAYDRENGIVYVLELFADEAKPVVHVWSIRQGAE